MFQMRAPLLTKKGRPFAGSLLLAWSGMMNKQHIIECLRGQNPVRDWMLVEKRIPCAYIVPLGTEYFVPDGTSDWVDDQCFLPISCP